MKPGRTPPSFVRFLARIRPERNHRGKLIGGIRMSASSQKCYALQLIDLSHEGEDFCLYCAWTSVRLVPRRTCGVENFYADHLLSNHWVTPGRASP